MINDRCTPDIQGRRRIFWTTLEACGKYNLCGAECSIPGLQYIDMPEGRTISTKDWMKSLILNILNTRARSDLKCPAPLGTYGHWSESYRDDDLYIGTRLYNVAEKSYTKIADGVKAIGAAIRSDLGKLVIQDLISDVDVDVVYRSKGRVDVTITIVSNARYASGTSRQIIGLSGTYAVDTWVWN
jgi:hypothetical protein